MADPELTGGMDGVAVGAGSVVVAGGVADSAAVTEVPASSKSANLDSCWFGVSVVVASVDSGCSGVSNCPCGAVIAGAAGDSPYTRLISREIPSIRSASLIKSKSMLNPFDRSELQPIWALPLQKMRRKLAQV